MRNDAERALRSVAAAPDGLAAEVAFAPDLPVFAGHFPGAPLVPGVLLIDAVRAACERLLGRPLPLREIRDARFLGPLLPGETAALAVRLRDDAGVLRADASWTGPRGPVAELRLSLG